MRFVSRALLQILAALLLIHAPVVRADASPPTSAVATDPNFIAARKAIDAKDWKKAIAQLNRLAADADVLNYLGYSHRKLGNYDEAFRHYKRALGMDPDHRGAHEYIGEAYLLTNNLAAAERHLAALNRLCGVVCEEYKDLAREIAEYKKKR